MSKYDITGNTYGYLTVIKRHGMDNNRRNSTWLCKCKCGNYSVVIRSALVGGHTSSCGCKIYESINVTHGMSKTRLYSEWSKMRSRCNNANKKDFKDYQGRGITVCNEWNEDFVPFMEWAIAAGYTDELTIDRIDNDKGYCPENCRWITIEEQQQNKRNNIYIFYKGEKKCLRTVCVEIGFNYKTAYGRYRRLLKSGREITEDILFASGRQYI